MARRSMLASLPKSPKPPRLLPVLPPIPGAQALSQLAGRAQGPFGAARKGN